MHGELRKLSTQLENKRCAVELISVKNYPDTLTLKLVEEETVSSIQKRISKGIQKKSPVVPMKMQGNLSTSKAKKLKIYFSKQIILQC